MTTTLWFLSFRNLGRDRELTFADLEALEELRIRALNRLIGVSGELVISEQEATRMPVAMFELEAHDTGRAMSVLLGIARETLPDHLSAGVSSPAELEEFLRREP